VKLVRSLLGWHIDICAERNHWLIKNNFEATAVSVLPATSSNNRAAILGLGQWGYEIYQGVCRRSAKLQVDEEDSVLVCSRKDGELCYRHELNVGARECICKPHLACCGIQCEHLLLVSGKFDLSLWHKRWHHRAHGISTSQCDRPEESADDLLSLVDGDMGEESLSRESVDPDLFSQRALENDSVLTSQQSQQSLSRPEFLWGKCKDWCSSWVVQWEESMTCSDRDSSWERW